MEVSAGMGKGKKDKNNTNSDVSQVSQRSVHGVERTTEQIYNS